MNFTSFHSKQSAVSSNGQPGDSQSSVDDKQADLSASTDEDHLNQIYGKSTGSEPEHVSDTEVNEAIYLVTIEPTDNELFLVVSDQSIREKNTLTGR